MRVCPKCGYEDEPYWRASAFKRYISVAHIDNILLDKPKLAKQLEDLKFAEDEFYAYHLTRFRNVERQAKCDNPNWKKQWQIPIEKGFSRKLPSSWRFPCDAYNRIKKEKANQRRLFEEIKK